MYEFGQMLIENGSVVCLSFELKVLNCGYSRI